MTKNQDKVLGHVLMHFSDADIVSENEIEKVVDIFARLSPLSGSEKKEIIRELQTRLQVRIDRGNFIQDSGKDHAPWYNAAKAAITPMFWNRYTLYLMQEKGWNRKLIDEMDRSTDEMMDLAGNPNMAKGFQRRGLCMGDIQSGKTANYIGLINKAADAGYKIIILLTGVIEKLRSQTQERIDSGFIGLDSAAFTRNNRDVWIGAGNLDPGTSAVAVTSVLGDFSTTTAEKMVARLNNFQSPVIFVLKKNKRILENLERWLRVFNNPNSANRIDSPMLLIDDEADNASINTKPDNECDPTAINQAIRSLLNLFTKVTYIGYTATPYANIFIDPDSKTEMLNNDIFPRNFIYALPSPSNYIGARNIFPVDAKYHYMLKANDDCEGSLPIKHKNGTPMHHLPESLKEALASFFIANAVRDLRGHHKSHRTMMINISRFISVHKNIVDVVDAFVRQSQREIHNYYLRGEDALKYEIFVLLKKVFNKHFALHPSFEFTWKQIQQALKDAVMPITVRAVSGGNATRELDYGNVPDGLRLIAVGGLSLSRGLTLEGLCVSYFFRNSMMYDTLMQMGRWFGYREGYADLCQIWLPKNALDWYTYISEATDDLRKQLGKMQQENRTPEDFGLAVRSDEAGLLVTARNKMRTARDYTLTVTLSGRMVETPFLHGDATIIQKNANAVEYFLKKLFQSRGGPEKDPELASNTPQYLNVPKKEIHDFLKMYLSHSTNMEFQTDNLAKFIEDDESDSLDLWDVAIATGKGKELPVGGIKLYGVKRGFALREDLGNALQISGRNSRLGGREHAKAGLTRSQVKDIEQTARQNGEQQKEFSQNIYFGKGIARNPLLVIYPVCLDDKGDQKKNEFINSIPQPVYGLSIGIPDVAGMENKKYNYKINLVKFRELMGIDDEEFEEIDETIPE